MTLYKIRYKWDNGCREDEHVAIILSESEFSSKQSVELALARYLDLKSDDIIQVKSFIPISMIESKMIYDGIIY